MRHKITYTLLSFALAISLAVGFQARLNVNPYITWIAAFSVVTWGFYGLDKRTSELKFLRAYRVPEVTLNLLALAGGFPGAWVGRSMFEHKTNLKRHKDMFAILILSTVLHTLFTLRLLIGPPMQWWPPAAWTQLWDWRATPAPSSAPLVPR